MTPEERVQVAELFERLATLEGEARDVEAEGVIAHGLRRAPHALYALVQTALVQDEALKQADARIRELEEQLGLSSEPPPSGSFLDSMRDALFGHEPRGSVPPVREDASRWSAGRDAAPPAPEPARGGSFLGTAAAGAAGAIGGALLLNSLRGMLGGGQAHAAYDRDAGGGDSPWESASGGSLAREAGLGDIGGPDASGSGRRAGLFDADAGDSDTDSGGAFDDADFDDSDTA